MVYRFIQKILKGKTLFRFLTEESLRKELFDLKGNVLDLASGATSYKYLFSEQCQIIRTDLEPKDNMVQRVDCNKPLPFENESFDTVLFVNALYTLEDRESFVKEVYRVLVPGGRFICVSPFIANEMAEPHDYCRLTHEGLGKLLRGFPWSSLNIQRIGERFSASANLIHPAIPFSFLRVPFYGIALILDFMIPKRVKDRHPTPLGYTIVAIK